jgi:hypothetical protein
MNTRYDIANWGCNSLPREVNIGSTSIILRLKPGVMLKSPRLVDSHSYAEGIKLSFVVEEKILKIPGDHPRIMKYGSLPSSSSTTKYGF